MFTGIVKELGTIKDMDRSGNLNRLSVESRTISKTVNIGGSVAVNGVCLTAVANSGDAISFDVMDETIARTDLSGLKRHDRVNLEDSIRSGDPMGGHFVLGHIDCVGVVKSIKENRGSLTMEISFPKEFSALVVEKGSVALDGVSVTIGETGPGLFKIYLIPHTLKCTTLGQRKSGNSVNIEFDIVGKYIAKLSAPYAEKDARNFRVTNEFLKAHGF